MEEKRQWKKPVTILLFILLAVSLGILLHTIFYKDSGGRETTVMIPDSMLTPQTEEETGLQPSDAAVPDEASEEDPADGVTEGGGDDERESSTGEIPAAGSTGSQGESAGREAAVISLHNKRPEDNQAFQVKNMVPGDAQTQYFCVRVSYKGTVTVRFHADIYDGYEKLAEVLKVKIRLLNSEDTLYDGLMRDMPSSLAHTIFSSESREEELYYEITAYLDTSVGNAYQQKSLLADFHWWAEENKKDGQGGGSLEAGKQPATGDPAALLPWMATAAVSALLLLLLLREKSRETDGGKRTTAGRLTVSILTIILLLICQCGIAYALIRSEASVENNRFQTGTVEINLNDGKPVIEEWEYLFEPGMTVEKDFFIESLSTVEVYYKLYFENIEGGLADALKVTLRSGDKVLYSGTLSGLTRESAVSDGDVLKPGERRTLTVVFYLPQETGDNVQNRDLAFDISALAVQTRNNPERKFD